MAIRSKADSIDVPVEGALEESAPIEVQVDPATPVAVESVNDRRRVAAYDKETGERLPNKVPLAHLDGRFPNLVATPTSKEGK